MNKNTLRYSVLLVLVAYIVCLPLLTRAQDNFEIPALPTGIDEEIGHDERYVVHLLDEADELITQAAISLGVGDTYIGSDNTLYEVTHVEEGTARVVNRGLAEMPNIDNYEMSDNVSGLFRSSHGVVPVASNKDEAVIGIYHTHSAESYEPTSGDAFKDRGDVIEVGEALKAAFEAEGFKVVMSDRSHLPHDGGAYQRSRRTAAEISRHGPVTMLDVHRDAIPDPDFYRVEVNGNEMTGVRLVVGKQNQNREANLEYAKRIKAIADKEYPGLVLGIFHAQGNYNQDLGPRMILLEFGTHKTTLEEAKRSTEPIAKVITAAAGLDGANRGGANAKIGGGAWRTIGWIVLILLLGVAAWVWLNKEGLGLDRFLREGGGDGEKG